MNKPKILHLVSWLPDHENPLRGNFCLRQIEAAALFSDSVWLRVVTGGGQPPFHVTEEAFSSCRCVTVHIPPSNSKIITKSLFFRGYNKGFAYIRRHLFNPDLVHLHVACNAGVMALYWKKRHHLPFVLSEHSSCYLQVPRGWVLPFSRKVANEAACVMPVSRFLADAMRQKGIKSPMEIIPNVLKENYLEAFPQPAGEKVFQLLHVSTLDKVKHFIGILHVMERLQKETDCDFVLNVVHDFPADMYQDWVNAHHLQERVRFLGAKNEEELLQIYTQSDVLVMFSHMETFSCTVMEAVGVGIPVIATNTGAIPEMLAGGRGVVVEPGDEETLFDAVVNLMKNGLSLHVSQHKAYARAVFSMETVGRRIGEVYLKVLSVSGNYCQTR